ncbi:MAG: fluoride efflux transporter CrcB [Alphaproteobacteria bacterium]|nr:fluoride efflux transporter CrcB [Alphaproteobacteria bacterium]
MNNILVVFLGGGLGSVLRLGINYAVSRTVDTSRLPWHTLTANLLGALIMGVLVEALALRINMPSTARYALVTGFLGGLTTFSAFSLENALMLERGAWMDMAFYIFISVAGTLAAVLAGSWLARTVI